MRRFADASRWAVEDSSLVNPDARWRTHTISDKQRALLERLGVPYDTDLSRGAASDLISAELAKRELLNN
jgi:hypothetical protein